MRALVAIGNASRDWHLVDVGRALGEGGELVLASVVEVPGSRSLAAAQPRARSRRRELETLARRESFAGRVVVKVARRALDAIAEAVEREQATLLVLGWPERSRSEALDELLAHPPCDVVVVHGDIRGARRILVPVRGGRYAQLAVAIASALAARNDGNVTLLHATEPGRDAPRTRSALYDVVGAAQHSRIGQLVSAVGPAADVIRAQLPEHDLVVLGATAREGASSSFGPIAETLATSGTPLLVVRTRTPVASRIFAARSAMPVDRRERSGYISELVDKWFAENTFVSSEFADLERLVDEKRKQGLTISLGLPALNEEETIGDVVYTMRTRLMGRYPLVDEIVVIDSGSEDRTPAIAQGEGVPVYTHQEIAPELGAYSGKGEALWKSLFVLRGDIVCWVDTDIRNIHPKFVYGIVGPLLVHPRLQYVKAFYQRPLGVGEAMQATGGGRVTELAARPILNLFFPELSGMIQPLSGEYGGRRTLLEQLPFFTGYGVETGLLIDVLQRAGLDAIAQTDMKQRIHRNQSLLALSQMSFALLQVALKRVGESTGRAIWEEANSSLKLIREDRGRYRLAVQEIVELERPPLISVPQYRVARSHSA
ncbi:MAG TPA: glucosyl-3-phosphoglycerate synthase [Candidatus Limnocylindria bacterium]|nr:glucosyl-3-phosphoglycerate synthase [Candidatus Limnocylindria bacterium]